MERVSAPPRGISTLLAIMISLVSIVLYADPPQTEHFASDRPSLETIRNAIQAGKLDKAVAQLAETDLSTAEKTTVARILAQTALLAQKHQKLKLSIELFGDALGQLEDQALSETNTTASNLPPRETPLRSQIARALASIYQDCKNRDDIGHAILSLHQLTSGASDWVNTNAPAQWASDALRYGQLALESASPDEARMAYQSVQAIGDQDQQPAAALGLAWSALIDPNRQAAAAELLETFTHQFSDHPDAAVAASACTECLASLGRDQDASRMLSQLLGRWPDSQAAFQRAAQHARLPFDQMPESVKGWIFQQSRSQTPGKWPPEMTATAIRIAVIAEESGLVDLLMPRLLASDTVGQATADLLAGLAQSDQADAAERIAAGLISPPSTVITNAKPREAACRWAGRAQKWSLLATAADTESPQVPQPSRSVGVERLFAESLMRLGRTGQALVWWNHLVDHRQVDDFATLLRCAEAETAVGSDSELAAQRIGDARRAAGEDAFSISLVDLLAAEVAIRRSKFDQARSLLENVIRGVEVDGRLRGRAQWLIGETFYIQQKFSDAIDAYRRVETISPDGPWVAAALVQAGKSFEQLGRTREAVVCYGNLLSRFADSPHAETARVRMASLAPSDPSRQQR